MAITANIFNGKLNLDIQPHRIPNGDFIDAFNITRDAEGEGMDAVVSNINGNTLVPFVLPTGTNKVIGSKEDLIRNREYIFRWNSNGFHTISYYDKNLDIITKVFESKTDSGAIDILQFDRSQKIHSVDILNNDDGDILFFIDSLKRPSQINIGKAISSFYGVYKRSYFDVAKEPPFLPPKAIYENDTTVEVNNLKKRLFKFKHRFIFENDETSVWSSQSEIPLPYNATDPATDTDPKLNSRIAIVIQTGELNVKKVEIAGAVSIGLGFSDFFSIDVIDKDLLGLFDNDLYIYRFFNDKAYITIDPKESIQEQDFVPRQANTQAMANGNTIEYAGILEGFNRIEIDANAESSLTDDEVFQYQKSLFYAQQRGVEIHIVVLGTIQDSDTFTIVTTNNTLQYIANVGDTVGDVINGLAAEAIADGFFISQWNTNGNLVIFKTGESLELSLEIPDTPTAFSDVTPAYDWYSKFSFGLVYFDEKGRNIGGVLTKNSLTVQANAYSVVNTLPYIDIEIDNRPPIEASYYHIVRSKNLSKQRILQWVSSTTFKDDTYAYISIASLNQYILDNPGTATQLGYTAAPGDRIRFIHIINNGVKTPFVPVKDFEIASSVENPTIGGVVYTGQFIKIYLPPTTLVFDFGEGFENYFIELYTPAQSLSENLNLYYEFGEEYLVLNPGTATRVHQGQMQNQAEDLSLPAFFRFKKGDYYYRARTISIGELKLKVGDDPISTAGFLFYAIPTTIESGQLGASYIVQDVVGGEVTSGVVDGTRWAIKIIDGKEHTLRIMGSVAFKSNVGGGHDINIKAVSTKSMLVTPVILGTHTGVFFAEEVMTVTFDETITYLAGTTKIYFTFEDFDGFQGDFVGGNFTITDSDQTFIQNVIDQNFSDFYPSAVNSNGRAWAIQPNAREIYNPVLIRFSQEYQPNTEINGINRFYEDNFDEYDRSCGDIMRLFVDGRLMYVFQKFDVGVVPVLTQIVKDTAGNPLEANSDILLNKIQYPYQGKFGIGDAPCSFAFGKHAKFFVDTNKNAVCRLSNNGIDVISIIYDVNSFFQKNIPHFRIGANGSNVYLTGTPNIYATYNHYTNKYILALEEINEYDNNALVFHQDASTIAFNDNEQQRGFESFYGFYPEYMGTIGNLLLTFKNGDLKKHNSATYCNFEGVQQDCYITPVLNEKGLEKKSWISLTEVASGVWDCPEITTQVNSYGTQKQRSSLPSARFKSIEGEYHAVFLRDTNRGGLINGDVLKGTYMIVKLRVANASSFVFLNMVSVKYLNSALVPA